MQLVNRTTCLYCEQEGRITPLVETDWGGCCPIHSRDFLQRLGVDTEALIRLSNPDLSKGEAA